MYGKGLQEKFDNAKVDFHIRLVEKGSGRKLVAVLISCESSCQRQPAIMQRERKTSAPSSFRFYGMCHAAAASAEMGVNEGSRNTYSSFQRVGGTLIFLK